MTPALAKVLEVIPKLPPPVENEMMYTVFAEIATGLEKLTCCHP